MGFIIVLIVIGVGVYFYKSSSMSDPSEVKNRYKNRNDEQKKVIRYFAVEGCLSKTMNDAQYEELVKTTISKQDSKKKKTNKIK